MSSDQSLKAATTFTIAAAESASASCTSSNGVCGSQSVDSSAATAAALLLPDRLRKRLQAERKCRPTNEQLDQKLARAEQRRQKQCAKRAASAREAEARCRRVTEAMEALHARRPESRGQVMQRFTRLQRDLQLVLGRFSSEVERTNCDLFAGAPLLAFGTSAAPPPTSTSSPQVLQVSPSMLAQQQQQTPVVHNAHKRPGTAFVVDHTTQSSADASAAASEMPARLKQRLAAYPKRRGRHELKAALEKKLADAQRRKERYEQRRAESIKETEERCRRISETMEEISLSESDSACTGQQQQQQHEQQQPPPHRRPAAAESPAPSSYYRRVAKLQVDLDCLFTKFNREFVTVRGRPIDLLESLMAAGGGSLLSGQQPHQQALQLHRRSAGSAGAGGITLISSSSVACQTESQRCCGCGSDPNLSER